MIKKLKLHESANQYFILNEEIIDALEDIDVSVKQEQGSITFNYYSNAGHDFYFAIDDVEDLREVLRNIYNYYQQYDVYEEANLWSEEGEEWDDDKGEYVRVGRNGAPHDYDDIVADMEECKNKILETYAVIKQFV